MDENERSLIERFCLLCAVVLVTFLPNFAMATEWDTLSEAQQGVLQRHQEGWSALPEQQRVIRERMQRFNALPPERKKALRQ